MKAFGALAVAILGIGCAEQAQTGNQALGIATFRVAETSTVTTVVGADAAGHEVARLDLVHGRFALTGVFREDYPTAEVVGRKLDIAIRGNPRLVWETEGFDPVLELPAQPESEREVATFLADPHVKSVLDRWQIGFAHGGDEAEYTTGSYAGTSYASCNNASTCGSVRSLPINTCGAGAAAVQAGRISRSSPDDELLVEQCCPAGSGGQSTNWFAVKACPTTSANNYRNTCGNASSGAACKSCPSYPMNAAGFCSVSYSGSTLDYAFQPPCTTTEECWQYGDSYYCDFGTQACLLFDAGQSQCPDGTPCNPGDTCYPSGLYGDYSICPPV